MTDGSCNVSILFGASFHYCFIGLITEVEAETVYLHQLWKKPLYWGEYCLTILNFCS